jgi:hypothetical protein
MERLLLSLFKFKTLTGRIALKQIILLWGVPRSISTAFERYFIERKDFAIVHEPFSYPYYFGENRQTGIVYQTIDESMPKTYDGCVDWIYKEAQEKPVFVKDMSFQPFTHVMKDDSFLGNITSTFLIRDPNITIRSYYGMQQDLSAEEIGFECSWKLFEKVRDLSGKEPVVVQAEDLEDNPEGTMRAYCEACGIPFIKEALYWKAGTPKVWEHWAEWHGDAINTCGIQKNVEKFDFEIKDKPALQALYDHHRPFYEKLKAHVIRPKN